MTALSLALGFLVQGPDTGRRGHQSHLALKASKACCKSSRGPEGGRNCTRGEHTQDLMCTRTQGEEQQLHRSLGQTHLLAPEALLAKRGLLWLTVGTTALVAKVLGHAHWCELS